MNQKQLIILVACAVLLGGAGLLLMNRDSASFSGAGQALGEKLLSDFDYNEVASISIRDVTGEVTLRFEGDRWRVVERNNYPADFTKISSALIKLKDLAIMQSEPIATSQLGRMDLLRPGEGTPSGTVVEMKNASGETVSELILGKEHLRESPAASPMGGGSWPDGRYVLLPSRPNRMTLVGEPLSEFEAKPQNWLNKDFFKIQSQNVKSISIESPTNSWALGRESATNAWQLGSPQPEEELDTTRVSSVVSPLGSPGFVDVVPESDSAETGLDEPVIVNVETFDGLAYTLRIGALNDQEQYPLAVEVTADLPDARTAGEDESPEDKERLDKEFADKQQTLKEKLEQEKRLESWTFLVSKWTADPLLKPRKDLLKEKQEAEDVIPETTGDAATDSGLDLVPENIIPLPPLPDSGSTGDDEIPE